MTEVEQPPRGGRPTLKDVAAQAGVAFKTVSRVVNGEPGVSPATRELVQRAIDELGFRRNASAAGLRQGSTGSIALVIEDIAEPIQSAVARAVERAAVERQTLLFTASSSDDDIRERELVLSLAARPVDGVILIPQEQDHAYLQVDIDAGLAVVAIDRPIHGVAIDTVLSDNREGARRGVEHLIAHGHSRIAFIGDKRMVFTSAERYQGYRDALQGAGIQEDPDLVLLDDQDPAHIGDGLATMRALADPPTAMFTVNSLNTMAVLRVVGADHGMALVAFDDLALFDLLTPAITAIAQDPASMGAEASRLLFERIAGENGPPRTVIVPTTLITRGSGERPPVSRDLR
jgi:LacI family transcriptional regulator